MPAANLTPSTSTYDVAIIGGGILGLSIAHEIVRRRLGWQIALIRDPQYHGGASEAAGAMLSGFGETTRLNFETDAGRAKVEWRSQAAKLWPAWAESLNANRAGNPIHLGEGTFIIINAISGTMEEKNLASLIGHLSTSGEPFEEVSGEIAGLRPSPSSRPLRAVFVPNERFTDASTVLRTLEKELGSANDVTLIDAEWIDVAASGVDATSHEILTDKGRVLAGSILLAAGAHSINLLKNFPDVVRRIPPLLSGVGTALTCTAPAENPRLEFAVRTPNRSFACGLHALPNNRGGLYIGATNNVHRDPGSKPALSDLGFLIDCATRQLDQRLQSSLVTSILIGNRPVSMDTFPLLGETSVRGLWLISGTNRDGFLMSPLIAQRVVDAIGSGERCLCGGKLFKPERPPLASARNVKSAIEEAIDNYLAIAVERGAVLPQVGQWENHFRAEVTCRVEAIYANFSPSFVLPPDISWDVEQANLMSVFKEYYLQAERIWT